MNTNYSISTPLNSSHSISLKVHGSLLLVFYCSVLPICSAAPPEDAEASVLAATEAAAAALRLSSIFSLDIIILNQLFR